MLNWRLIRSLGELQILTRASYLMLLFVPLLAGLWPGVRVVINQYNQVVTDATHKLEATSQKLQFQADRIGIALQHTDVGDSPPAKLRTEIEEKVKATLTELNTDIKTIVDSYAPKTIERTALPATWAFAFFAALSVFFGHLIYQISAPEIVRQTSIQDFVARRKDDYAKNPSEGALNRSRYFIEDARSRGIHIEVPPPPAPVPSLSGSQDNEMHRRWEMDLIETAAVAEYHDAAARNVLAIIAAGILYLFGIFIVLSIVGTQSLAVAKAADWI